MAADIVGYSRLIERDEAGTLAAIRTLRAELIDPLLAEHNGRIVKLMGDGAIVEFGSVVDAVACAVALQKAVAVRQAEVPPERRIVLPDRGQPRRRGGRGRGPARRRGQRGRPPGAALRARRGADLGHRLRPPAGQARPPARVRRRAAAQEHRPAGAGLPGAARRSACRAIAARPAGARGWTLPAAAAPCCARSWPPAASGGCGRASRRAPARPASLSCRSTTSAATRPPVGWPTGSPRTSSPTSPASATST